MRRFISLLVVVLFGLSLVAPALAADANVPEEETKTIASAEIADQATDTLATFVKRASSEKPEVRHRAWEMLTPDAQTNVFFGLEEAFYFVEGQILQAGDVTVENPSGVVVEVALKGLWHKYDFTNTKFVLTDDGKLIDSITMLETLVVPKDLTSTKVTIKFSDDTITTRRKPLVAKDVVLATVRNEGTTIHQIIIFRADGRAVEDLVPLQQVSNDDVYAVVTLQPNQERVVGLIMEPAEYVIAGVERDPANPDPLAGVMTVLTIVEADDTTK